MLQEQSIDLTGWWNEQDFAGKELFNLDDSGTITLQQGNNIKERTIAQVSEENKDTVIKNLQVKFSQLESKIRELEVEWVAAEDKIKLADKVASISEQLQQAQAIGDYRPLALLVHDWEHTIYTITEEHYAEKLKLTENAERLAQSEDWKNTSQAYRDIADKWKLAGQTDKSRSDKLWNRIEAARRTFQERKRLHQAEEEKDMMHNLDLKIDLVDQAEALAASEEWKKTSETFQRLMEEWKSIGHTVNKKNEELWQRFIAAKNAFFDRKKEHAGKIQVEREKNYEVKLAIVEKAEQLKDSTAWNKTAQEMTTLMDEWKKTGRAPQEKGDELWKRFQEARDQFFGAKRKHFDEQRSAQEQNYERKKELLQRAEEIKESNRWGETTDEMIELMEEWKKIGPIPRQYGDTLWEEFNAARKYFFARKEASREQRKQFQEYQKVSRAKEAVAAVRNLADEIKEEEEKLADFKNGLENITPGKKANELRAHLQNLVAETEERIKQLKQKYSRAEKDISKAAPKKESQHTETISAEPEETTEDSQETEG